MVLVAAACATSHVVSDWKDQSYQKKPQKIMVVALLDQQADRRMVEDELSKQLREEGTNAVPAYTVLPDGKRAGKELLQAKVGELGADAVLMTKLLDKKTVRDYVPGQTYFPPSAFGDWRGYYGGYYPPMGAYPPGFAGPGYPPVSSPGYAVQKEYAVAEANLYDAASGKLIWSAVTETEIRGNDQKAIRSYASRVMKSLLDQGLIS